MTQNNNTLAPINSETDEKALVSKTEQLNSKQDFWNVAAVGLTAASVLTPPALYFFLAWLPTVWLIALGAVAPALGFFAVWMANRRRIQLTSASADLNRAKDEKLLRDLKEKDLQMERVRADAELKIAALNTEAEKAREGIATAQAEAAKANLRAEELAQLNNMVRMDLFREQWARRRFEDDSAPREFAGDVRELLRFAGTKVEIIVLKREEPIDLSKQLFKALKAARWEVMPVVEMDDLSQFGPVSNVKIEVAITEADLTGAPSPLYNAAKTLDRSFRETQIAPMLWPLPEAPPDRIRVIIGSRPKHIEPRREMEKME